MKKESLYIVCPYAKRDCTQTVIAILEIKKSHGGDNNMLKRCMYLLIVFALAMVMIGCAAGPAGFFGPTVYLSGVNANSAREAQMENTVLFGRLFADKTFPTVYETARSGGITRIATVQFYQQSVALGFMTRYVTIVTGE